MSLFGSDYMILLADRRLSSNSKTVDDESNKAATMPRLRGVPTNCDFYRVNWNWTAEYFMSWWAQILRAWNLYG